MLPCLASIAPVVQQSAAAGVGYLMVAHGQLFVRLYEHVARFAVVAVAVAVVIAGMLCSGNTKQNSMNRSNKKWRE